MKFEEFCIERQISETTRKVYASVVHLYEELNNSTLDELLEEADIEEERGTRWKHRTLRKRLINFRTWLYENKSQGTAQKYMSSIRTIYNHFSIELHTLPGFSSKQIDRTYEKSFEDILTKNELIDAYHEASNVGKCIILFGSSTGISKIDMLNMKVHDFLTACSEYTTQTNIVYDQLIEIKNTENIIPVFKGIRQKTKTKYTTFSSPEATEHIVQYLLGRDAQFKTKYAQALKNGEEDYTQPCLTEDDPLFEISNAHLLYSFRKINNKLEFGKVGKFTKFRTHQLRSFHATTLTNLKDNPFTMDEVDTLQGRKLDSTHRAYFTDDVARLREKYLDGVDSLMLFKKVHMVDKALFDEAVDEKEYYKGEIVKTEERIEEIIKNQRELERLLGL